jgi:Ca2+-transporting ATPase
MPPPRQGASSGSGYHRQRPLTNLAIVPEATVSSSTSSFSRQKYNVNYPLRTSSPPASAYFPLLSGTSEPRPTPDAEAHFAYSTTLRRHPDHSLASPTVIAQAVNAEASSLYQRALRTISGQKPSEEATETGHASIGLKEEIRDTASARFAHHTVEVF